MGWKNIKEHYRIDKVVHVKRHTTKVNEFVQIKNITIVIGNIDEITISTDGVIIHTKDYYCDGDLRRVRSEMRSDPEKLRTLATSPDTFGPLTTVWTYDRNSLIEKQCEVVGWPNCCTDGELQGGNTHSPDRAIILQWALESAKARLELAQIFMNQKNEELQQARSDWRDSYRDLIKLEYIDA
jgi:hypothetical protein